MNTFSPFKQIAFENVPETPHVPHHYSYAADNYLTVESKHFGAVKTFYKTMGSGPDLLLVHGFMTTSYSWRYVIKPLAAHFRVIALDLPGAGRSSKPASGYHPDNLADFISEFTSALQIEKPLAIGNSLGGYLCMRLMLKNPGAFKRLVNLHSPGLVTTRMRALDIVLGLVPPAERFVEFLVNRDPERWVHQNIHYYDETLKSREEHREYAAPLRSADGLHAFYLMLKETLAVAPMEQFERDLKRNAFVSADRLQLIYAKDDPMVPADVGKRMNAILPQAQFHWLPRGSHFAHVDAPELFLEKALPFLLAGKA